jgi:ABC-type polysaccharide/polyol phosphate export permease
MSSGSLLHMGLTVRLRPFSRAIRGTTSSPASPVLWADVLTSLVSNAISRVITIGVALVMGFRSGASVTGWLAAVGILVLFTVALTWLAVVPG